MATINFMLGTIPGGVSSGRLSPAPRRGAIAEPPASANDISKHCLFARIAYARIRVSRRAAALSG
ncbi:hypothetical protein [Denitromonas sp.]|uniref:hypothetical protein n=1 Tax=Denitromonas sp. TaxID=2734609 RepID=UPI002AFF396A|nr:hypothetical protein [Denitromonas sp.]